VDKPREIIVPMNVKFTVANARAQRDLLRLVAESETVSFAGIIPMRRARGIVKTPEFTIELSSL
jgi:hypothetical protein